MFEDNTSETEILEAIVNELRHFHNYIDNCYENKKNDKNFNILNIEMFCQTVSNSLRKLFCELYGLALSNIDDSELIKNAKDHYHKMGITLITNKKYEKTLLTPEGYITYKRNILRPKNKSDAALLKQYNRKNSVIPLDEWLKISELPFKITAKAMLIIAEWTATETSYQAAVEAILKSSMRVNLTHETVRNVTDYIGKIIYEQDIEQAERTFSRLDSVKLKFPEKKKEGILYIEIDGAMLHTWNKNEDPKNPNVKWRENKLAILYSSDHMELKGVVDGENRYKLTKKEYVSQIGSIDIFKKLVFDAAISNGYGKYEKTVLISDGATWIRNLKLEFFPDAQQILDFWHLCEHIYEFSKKYFNNDPKKYTPWAEIMKEKFKKSNYNEALDEIIKMEVRMKVDKALSHYIEKNINNIDYANYRNQGFYIGSGHIESGNKSVAQERLKRPGMTWTKENAQHLLTLRAKLKSNLWGKKVVVPVLKHFKLI
jgi:hypothetical protein